MIPINKSKEPRELSQYRSAHGIHAIYDGPNFTPVKDAIRDSLVDEQRGLCAYCMRRIQPVFNSMKVEHHKSQARFPGEQLNYQNLLGTCLGNEGKPHREQTCDTFKKELDLSRSPANKGHHSFIEKIKYKKSGEIFHEDEAFNLEIGSGVLNLNQSDLVEYRKSAYEALIVLVSRYPDKAEPKLLRAILKKMDGKDNLEEFYGLKKQVLENWIREKEDQTS